MQVACTERHEQGDPERAGPGMVLLDVTCPPEVGPGALLSVERPSDGAIFEVVVPDGVESGIQFQCEVPDEPPLPAVEPSPGAVNDSADPSSSQRLCSQPSSNAPSHPGSSSGDAEVALTAAVEAKTLTEQQAAALKDIDAALRDYSALGWFIECHCRDFREWQREGEQKLEWHELHGEYVRLVENKVEQQLSYLGATGDDLYALLEEVVAGGGDRRAESFLKKLLAMGDYEHFADMMRWLGRVESRKYTTSL